MLHQNGGNDQQRKQALSECFKQPWERKAAARYRGWWYYIDGSDPKSKISFDLFHLLMATRLAETAKTFSAAPLLTVPVN